MRTKKLAFLALTAALAMTLWGCGSNKGSNGGTAPEETAHAVGIDVCVQCHDVKGATWLASRHGNNNLSPSSQYIPGESSCAECHNPLNDGSRIQAAFGTKVENRNVVGCESCHGGGSQHYGLGPIPRPEPGPEVCGGCHDRTDHHGESSIYDKYQASRHVTGPIESGQVCQRCHSHEGALASDVRGYTGDKTVLYSDAAFTVPGKYAAPAIPEEELSPIQCATCHDPHSVGQQLRTVFAPKPSGAEGAVLWDPNHSGGTTTDQFDLCTSCHNYNNNDDMFFGSGSVASGTVPFYHNTAWYRILPSTHRDNPATADVIEGYVLRTQGENPCFDCHGHEMKTLTRYSNTSDPARDATSTIYTEWAQSGHAGRLLTNKYDVARTNGVNNSNSTDLVDAVMAAGATAESGPAWVEEGYAGASDACKRCHTATGASAYLRDPATYNPATLDFSHLSGDQREVLYCWGCHESARDGILHEPGAITAGYKFRALDGTVAFAQFPDVEASNVCIACHAARESGESVKAISDFTNVSFKNSHYMGAAGLMYVKAGYTNFIAPSTFLDGVSGTTYGQTLTSTDDGGTLSSTHRKLGTTAINGDSHNLAKFVPGFLDSLGPCVVCHMADLNDQANHSWEIDGNAFTKVCVNCHTSEGTTTLTPENFLEVFVDEQAIPFEDALALAEATLASRYGITYNSAYPYWYKGGVAVKDWTIGGTANGEKVMGAAFNLNLLKRDPAAYVHARTYARRLLYDTIDWLDDGSVNMSTGATALAWNSTKYVKDTTAGGTTTESFKYLAGYNRTSQAWNALERP